MYKIIGADQREYGPASAEQLRKWIAEGRANAQTKVQAGGVGDWKPLSEFAEFGNALAAKAATSPPPKIGRATDGEKLALEIIARDYRLDIGDCCSRSWKLLTDNFWLLAGASALIFILRAALGPLPILGISANVILGFVLQGGLGLLFLKRLRGERADIGVAFSGFSLALLPLILAGIIAHVLTGLGFLLCILPGIYLLVAWWLFTPLLILDRGLDFWPAMECSRKVVTHHWWQCFGLALMAFALCLFGGLLCVIGLFITMPIATGAIVCAYEDIFGKPKVAPAGIPSAPAPADIPVVPATPPTPPAGGENRPSPPEP